MIPFSLKYLFSRFSAAISSGHNGGIGGGPLPSVRPFTIVAAVYILPILEVAPRPISVLPAPLSLSPSSDRLYGAEIPEDHGIKAFIIFTL